MNNERNFYSADTEFLTNNGWKLYNEIYNEKMITLNNDNHNLEIAPLKEKASERFQGFLYELDLQFSNCLVSQNHNMLISPVVSRNLYGTKYKRNLANWHHDSINNLIESNRSFFHVLNAPNPQQKEFEISDDYLRILGLFISDGTFSKFDKTHLSYKCVRITQTFQGKKDVFNIMDNLSYRYKFRKYNYEKETVWISYNRVLTEKLYRECGHGELYKRLPNWVVNLSERQLHILLYSLFLGDGTLAQKNNKTYGFIYYTANKKLAGDVQMLAVLAGLDNTIRGDGEGYFNSPSSANFSSTNSLVFQVFIKNQKSTPKCSSFKNYQEKGGGYNRGIKTIQYNGNIVSITTKNKNLITRRRGKVSIQS